MEDSKQGMKKKAMMDLLKQVEDMADSMIAQGAGEEMPGHMEKVMVAAPDKAGLGEGLDKAKALLGAHADMESPEEEASEMPSEEAGEDKASQIAKLEAELAKLKA